MRNIICVLLLSLLALSARAESPDFSDIEALPLMREAGCNTGTVPEIHHCTLYCIPDTECTEGYLILWNEDEREEYLFHTFEDQRPNVLLWYRGTEV